MGYNPPPPPLPFPMTRNSVPPPPPPPPIRVIDGGWPSFMKKKPKEPNSKVEVITRDYDGRQFIKYGDSDGYHMMELDTNNEN